MDKEKSAVAAFLEGTGNESMFEQPSKDPFEQIENKEEVAGEVKEEKPLPFHKDPKVQRYIQKEVEKLAKNIKVPEPERQEVKDNDDFYDRLIGNDTPEKVAMIKEAKARDEQRLQDAARIAREELSASAREEKEADREAEEELFNAFDNIEETYDVDITSNSPTAIKLQNEFRQFAIKIAPKDKNGDIVDYPDMLSAFETFSEMKKSSSQPSRAKELASRGLSRSSEATVKNEKRVDWNAVDDFMDTLK